MSDNNSEPASSTITWKRDEPIYVPSSGKERRIAVRYLDWGRIKKSLERCNQETPRLHLVYSALFGIGATSGFSLIAFAANPQANLQNWVYPLYSLVCFFSVLTGIAIAYVDRLMRKTKKSDVESIVEDMDAIEKTFTE